MDAALDVLVRGSVSIPAVRTAAEAAGILRRSDFRCFLSAIAWNSHRVRFGFELEDTIACVAEAAVHPSLGRLGVTAGVKSEWSPRVSGSRRG